MFSFIGSFWGIRMVFIYSCLDARRLYKSLFANRNHGFQLGSVPKKSGDAPEARANENIGNCPRFTYSIVNVTLFHMQSTNYLQCSITIPTCKHLLKLKRTTYLRVY